MVLSKKEIQNYFIKLSNNDSKLTELNISFDEINDEEAIAFAEVLGIDGNKTLTYLNLDSINFGKKREKAIREVLEAIVNVLTVNTTLLTLSITNNSIGYEGAIAIAKALGKDGNSTLKNLYLDNNEIGVLNV